MKIIYMGTPEIAAVILKDLLKGGHEVVLCVTQPDRPKGRGHEMAMSDVKKVALENNIPVYQPEKIREKECVEYLKGYDADIIVVAAFGQILSKPILEMTPFGCINVHASILPAYRGAAPIQWAIIDGLDKTGITIMQMDEGLDTGDIILKSEVSIDADETGGSLHDKLAAEGGRALLEAIELLREGKATFTPQGEATTHYAFMLNKKMGELIFTKSAAELERTARGLSPWPGAYTFLDGRMIKITSCRAIACETDCEPGSAVIIDRDSFAIKTGDGALLIEKLKPEGKKEMTAAEYLRGKSVDGKVFG
ncbi:MAG: methionyl-tRNA formyltransferase [Clostridiales bacterium]|nr:methionyl-tRNA formyltransferase [Clostridiales bacterium]